MHPGVKQDGSVNGGTWPKYCVQWCSACSEQTEILSHDIYEDAPHN